MEEILRYDMHPLVEAFSTRRGSSLPYSVTVGKQVHSDRIAVIDREGLSREDLQGYDALITDIPSLAIGVRTADCVPVLLLDPERRVVASVHSGWRGTVMKISCKTISVMKERFGCNPARIVAQIGPCIGADSFQVGGEVVEQFHQEGFPMEEIYSLREGTFQDPMEGGEHLDLVGANIFLLLSCGVPPGNIKASGIDTYRDPSFFSARREGASCGRTINSIRLL